MKKQLLTVLAMVGVIALFSPVAFSHSDIKPQHGGVVHSKYDLSFELVREVDSVSLYVVDHGEPFATDELTGQIMVLTGGKKSDAKLTTAGSGKLMASGVQIPDGAKVVVTLTNKNKDVMSVRYSF